MNFCKPLISVNELLNKKGKQPEVVLFINTTPNVIVNRRGSLMTAEGPSANKDFRIKTNKTIIS